MSESLPNWHQACTPHRDIREDAVSESLCAVNLSRLSANASITLALDLELKGKVNDHAGQMALREIGKRVVGLRSRM